MVFRPFYVQKEFLRKILSLPDFEIRDSDDTQTIILENIIRSSGTFFISGGYLRTVVYITYIGIVFIDIKQLTAGNQPVLKHPSAPILKWL